MAITFITRSISKAEQDLLKGREGFELHITQHPMLKGCDEELAAPVVIPAPAGGWTHDALEQVGEQQGDGEAYLVSPEPSLVPNTWVGSSEI